MKRNPVLVTLTANIHGLEIASFLEMASSFVFKV